MKLILTLLLLLFSLGCFSQNQISKKDKETYSIFLGELINGSVDKGIQLADSTYNIAIKENNNVLQALMLNILAYGNANNGDFSAASNFYSKEHNAIISFKASRLKDSLLLLNLNEHGNHYLNTGNFPKGIKKFHKSLSISKKNKDSLSISDAYNLLGNAYFMQKLYDDAIFYYKESLKFNNSKAFVSVINNNLGVIYTKKKDYKRAKKHLLETFKTTDTTNLYDLSTSYLNLASLYREMKNYEKAHTLFLKADEYVSQLNDKQYILGNKISLITSFTNIKDYASAKRYMKICDSLANEYESNSLKIDLYKAVYKSSAKMKDYKTAFENAEKYMVVHDSIFSIEKTEIIKDLKIKHESDLKETEIITQQKLIKTQQKQNIGLTIGLIIILISMLSMFFSYRKRLATQKELANEKMNTALEKEKVKTYQSYIDGQNKERSRMSQELHNGILGRLFGTRMGLSFVQCKQEDTNKQKLFLDELQHLEKEIRNLSLKLSDKVEDTELNFYNTVNQLLKETSFTGNFNFVLNASKDIEWDAISSLVKINLYRILQESIQNITKHAKAKQVVLDFSLNKDQLVMDIKDNGVGFSITENSDDINVKNISSRVNDIKGTFNISSKKEEGTVIQISIPYKLAL